MYKTKKHIQINELPKNVPDYKNSNEAKDILTEKWLTNWIKEGIKSKKIAPYSLLPLKSKIAYYLGVSVGTVQSAIRYIEDKGLVESKQRIGTYIVGENENNSSSQKLTGKRDLIIKQLLYFIVDNDLKIGDKIPSIRAIAKTFSISTNTVRLSIEYLENKGILKNNITNNGIFYTVNEIPIIEKNFRLEKKTLATKLEDTILDYIKENYKAGEKFLTHHELAEKFNSSLKTTHIAIKSLVDKGYLVSRRGQYGTIVVKTSQKETLKPKPETTIFAPAAQAAVYRYEKVKNYLKQMIAHEFNLGEKLPAMQDLANRIDVSTNTIKRALHDLAKEGYIGFSRGRYGGSFVINIPDNQDSAAFRWLAVNKIYVTK